jgi:hypothetical protein
MKTLFLIYLQNPVKLVLRQIWGCFNLFETK